MFDVDTAENLFFHICRTMKRFSCRRVKNVSELLFLVMALNHLREWIAPGYKRDDKGNWPTPKNQEAQFFQDIWCLPEFKIINKLCNGTKHYISIPQTTNVEYGLNIDEWESVDDVQNFDNGPPHQFEVDGVNVETVMSKVLEYYSQNWFNKPC